MANPVVITGRPGHVRVEIGGYLLAESDAVLEVQEAGHEPVMYFPRESVRHDRLRATPTTTHCPRKGDATYWSIAVGSCSVDDAVWSYETPFPAVERLAGYVAFRADAVDAVDEAGHHLLGPTHLDCGRVAEGT